MKENLKSLKHKLISLFLFLITSFSVHATNYYLAASGNDENNGTSPSSPWQSISRLNLVLGSLRPGDNIYFNRGDAFYGGLNITSSGSSGFPITISAYGSGAKPIITGFTTINSWNNLGGNIWESSNSVSRLPYTNMVAVNGNNTAMGRYPNSSILLPYQSYSSGYSITSSSLTDGTNWAGAELAFYISTYEIGRNPIISQSGGTLYYKASSNDGPIQYAPGWFNPAYFIQNDPRTLDTQNEWYYNPSTNKFRIYSAFSPSNVQVATVENLINLYKSDYVTIDNISFQGSNTASVLIQVSKYNIIQYCDFNLSGINAIYGPWAGNSTGLIISNCTINNSNNSGIDLSGDFDNATIIYNSISNSGIIPGMGRNGGDNGNGSYGGILTNGAGDNVGYNNVSTTGYIGIRFNGVNNNIHNNYVNGFCQVLLDGGGIYTANQTGTTNSSKVINNIVMNSPHNNGIYFDGKTNGVEVAGNTIANCSWGLYINNNWNMNVHDNTLYNNGPFNDGSSFKINHSELSINSSNISVNSNIFFARTAKQNVGYFAFADGAFPPNFSLNYNYYARPVDDNAAIFVALGNNYSYQSLAGWKNISGQDLGSNKSPLAVNDTNAIRFEYNPSSSNKTVSLDATYIDVKNNSYNGSITLAPYTSAVLIRNGAVTANKPPIANAGIDQTIPLPTTIVYLSGSGADSDGDISSYSWTKLSGPSGDNITAATSSNTTVTGLLEGVYQYQLTVTDNSGATGSDIVQITVKSAVQTIQSLGTLLPAVYPGSTSNGINYSYYEGTYSSVPDFSTITAVKTGTLSTYDISAANRNYLFAMNFTGYIYVPADGQYTFYTTSDDGSNLTIDNNLVVNNDGLHGSKEVSGTVGLQAGYHAISAAFFQQFGGEVFTVSYSSSSISKQTIPSSALYIATSSSLNLLPALNISNAVNGLDYTYYEGNFNTIPNFSDLTPTLTSSMSNFNISNARQNSNFAYYYSGYIYVPTDGQYIFYTNSDDGSNLSIDNVLVVNNDGLHAAQEQSGKIGLKAGFHSIGVSYFQQYGGSVLRVSEEGPGISKQAIPSSVLYHVVSSSGNGALSLNNGNQIISSSRNEASIKAYPNPFTDYIKVTINGDAGKYQLQLVDVSGKIIYSKTGVKGSGNYIETINTSILQSGFYFIRVIQNNKVITIKLIKGK